MQPGPIGGHNWQPMSYSPTTGHVYLPAREGAFFYMAADHTTFQSRPGVFWNTGLNPASSTLPDDEAVRKAIRASAKDPGDGGRSRLPGQRYRQVRGV